MEECKLPFDDDKWYDEYFDSLEMNAAMAKLMYNELKQYGNFGFEEPSDWKSAVDEAFSMM